MVLQVGYREVRQLGPAGPDELFLILEEPNGLVDYDAWKAWVATFKLHHDRLIALDEALKMERLGGVTFDLMGTLAQERVQDPGPAPEEAKPYRHGGALLH